MTQNPTHNRGIVVFSGGSATNTLVDVFNAVRETKNCPLSYIIPISDNGGSSSELIRVFGGPGIGDVRSRLVRLIPPSPPTSERSAIASLFNHRLSTTSSTLAEREFQAIVSGTSPLWTRITPAKRELIRSFFNLLNLEILKRARPPSSTFDFASASVGNLFLTGARLFSGSFESAIYLLGSICGVPDDIVRVIPAINSNFSHHISAGLADGSTIVGQNSISHPSSPTALPDNIPQGQEQQQQQQNGTATPHRLGYDDDSEDPYEDDSANLPGSLPTLRSRSNLRFSKAVDESLPARIERIWYINPYGQEIRPPANPRVLDVLRNSQAIIYSIGSLYTSIVPSIVLRGVGEAIAAKGAGVRQKILILNGSLDRETSGPDGMKFTAIDFVEAIVRAGEESRSRRFNPAAQVSSPSAQDLLSVNSNPHQHTLYCSYVTHILHLDGEGTPKVDRKSLNAMGIECLRLYGRKVDGGRQGMIYDGKALAQALEAILGRKGDAMVGERSRRNTLEG